MFRAILTFLLGITIILLILGAISSSFQPFSLSKKAARNTQSLQLNSENTDEIVVRSEQALSSESDTSSLATDTSNTAELQQLTAEDKKDALNEMVAQEIEILLAQEASLTNIIETNISLLGKLGTSTAFLSHQALLKKIQRTDDVQPISIICSQALCNVLVYGADAAIAESFATAIINENIENLPVTGGEFRIFHEKGYEFAHVVLDLSAN